MDLAEAVLVIAHGYRLVELAAVGLIARGYGPVIAETLRNTQAAYQQGLAYKSVEAITVEKTAAELANVQAQRAEAAAEMERTRTIMLETQELIRLAGVEQNEFAAAALRGLGYKSLSQAQLGAAAASKAYAAAAAQVMDMEAADAALTARLAAEKAALAASMEAATVASSAFRSVGGGILSMLGGWPGAIMLAATSLYIFRDSIFGAKEETLDFEDAVRSANQALENMGSQSAKAIDSQAHSIRASLGQLQGEITRLQNDMPAKVRGIDLLNVVSGADNPAYTAQLEQIRKLKQQAADLEAALRQLDPAKKAAIERDKTHTQALGAEGDALQQVTERLREEAAAKRLELSGQQALEPLIKAEAEYNKILAKEKQSLALIEKSGSKEAIAAQREKIAGMEREHQQIRETAQAVVDLNRRIESKDKSERESAKSAREAEAERKRVMEEGKRLTEQLATPQEQYNARVERAGELLRAGAISQEVYSRALREAASEKDGALRAFDDYLARIREESRILDLERSFRGPELEYLREKLRLQSQLARENAPQPTDGQWAEMRRQIYAQHDQEEANKQRRDLENDAKSIIEQTRTEEEKYRETLEKINEAKRAGVGDTQALIEAERRLKFEHSGLQEAMLDFGSAVSGAFESAVLEGKRFSDVLTGLLTDIERVIWKAMVLKPLENAIGGYDWSGAAGTAGGWLAGLVTSGGGAAAGSAVTGGGIEGAVTVEKAGARRSPSLESAFSGRSPSAGEDSDARPIIIEFTHVNTFNDDDVVGAMARKGRHVTTSHFLEDFNSNGVTRQTLRVR